jgi:hypothetical protein
LGWAAELRDLIRLDDHILAKENFSSRPQRNRVLARCDLNLCGSALASWFAIHVDFRARRSGSHIHESESVCSGLLALGERGVYLCRLPLLDFNL